MRNLRWNFLLMVLLFTCVLFLPGLAHSQIITRVPAIIPSWLIHKSAASVIKITPKIDFANIAFREEPYGPYTWQETPFDVSDIGNVWFMKEDPNEAGLIWIGTSSGLYTYDIQTEESELIITGKIMSFAIDPTGTNYYALSGGKLMYSKAGAPWKTWSGLSELEKGNYANGERRLAADEESLYVLKYNTNTIYVISHDAAENSNPAIMTLVNAPINTVPNSQLWLNPVKNNLIAVFGGTQPVTVLESTADKSAWNVISTPPELTSVYNIQFDFDGNAYFYGDGGSHILDFATKNIKSTICKWPDPYQKSICFKAGNLGGLHKVTSADDLSTTSAGFGDSFIASFMFTKEDSGLLAVTNTKTTFEKRLFYSTIPPLKVSKWFPIVGKIAGFQPPSSGVSYMYDQTFDMPRLIKNNTSFPIRVDGFGSIYPDKKISNRFYATAANKLYVSNDYGTNWTVLHDFLDGGMMIYSFLVDRNNSNTLYVGMHFGSDDKEGGVFKSVDSGATWKFNKFNSPERNLICWVIKQSNNPNKGGYIYVGTEISDHKMSDGSQYKPPLFRSKNGGVTWENVAGIIPHHVLSMDFDATDYSIYVIPENWGSLFKSTDDGDTWNKIDIESKIDSRGMFVLTDPKIHNKLYLSTTFANAGVYRSVDGGVSFESYGMYGDNTYNLWLSDSGDRLFVIGKDNIYYRSTQ